MYVHKACIKLPDCGKCAWFANIKTGEITALYTNHRGEKEKEVVIPARVQMYVNSEDWESSRLETYI